MRSIRILINVTFFIIANAVLPVDEQSSIGNSGSDNLLDPLNTDSTTTSDNSYLDHNVAPEQENVQSINYLNPDIAGGEGDSISISDSGKCASNLGKREDNGFTSAGAGGCLPSSKPESDDTLLLPNSMLSSILKLPKIKIPDAIQKFLERQRWSLSFLLGRPYPKKPKCETWQELVCCTFENWEDPLVASHVEDCSGCRQSFF